MGASLMRVALLAVIAIGQAAAVSAAQQKAPQPPPQVPAVEFTVEVLGSKMAEFVGKMDEYDKLRSSLQVGLPPLAVTANPKEIQQAERSLAARIRKARAGSRRHDIFTEETRRAFRQMLRPLATAANCALIADDNPGEWFWAVNSEYPKQNPVSTVPAAILAVLPKLPEDVFYRFLDTDLVLHDTKANIMLDRIENAIRCR